MEAEIRTKRLINCQFEEQFDNWLETFTPEERLRSGRHFLLGTTSNALKSIGVDNCEIYWNSNKIAKIMNEHSGMTADVIKSVPQILEYPILIMQSKTVRSRMTMFGDTVDANGKPVLAALEFSPNKTMEIADYAVIASAYGKKGVQNFINSSEILYVEPNKKRTDKWLLALRLQLPSPITIYSPTNNIHNSSEKINQKNSDIDNNKIIANTEPVESVDIKMKASLNCQFRKQFDNETFTPEAINRRFNNELQQQIDGILPKGHVYNLGYPREVLSSIKEIPDLPIQLRSDRLALKANDPKHPFCINDVKDLPRAINNPLAVFAYGDPQKAVNIITEIAYGGKNFLAGMSLDPVVGGEKLQVNNIRNVFPKDTAEWINWINQGKGLYYDKERVLSILGQRQMISSGVAVTNDVSVNKPADVVFSFSDNQSPENRVRQGRSKPQLSLSESDIRSAADIVRSFNPINNIYNSSEKINQKNSDINNTDNNKNNANIEPIIIKT